MSETAVNTPRATDAVFIRNPDKRNPDKLLPASCRTWLYCNQMRQDWCNILVEAKCRAAAPDRPDDPSDRAHGVGSAVAIRTPCFASRHRHTSGAGRSVLPHPPTTAAAAEIDALNAALSCDKRTTRTCSEVLLVLQ